MDTHTIKLPSHTVSLACASSFYIVHKTKTIDYSNLRRIRTLDSALHDLPEHGRTHADFLCTLCLSEPCASLVFKLRGSQWLHCGLMHAFQWQAN